MSAGSRGLLFPKCDRSNLERNYVDGTHTRPKPWQKISLLRRYVCWSAKCMEHSLPRMSGQPQNNKYMALNYGQRHKSPRSLTKLKLMNHLTFLFCLRYIPVICDHTLRVKSFSQTMLGVPIYIYMACYVIFETTWTFFSWHHDVGFKDRTTWWEGRDTKS